MRVSMMLSLMGLRVAEAREVADGIEVHALVVSDQWSVLSRESQ